MTYASIMVAVDLRDDAPARLRLAGRLAHDFHARLIGVAAEPLPYVVAPPGPTLGSSYCVGAATDLVRDRIERAHAAFRDAAGAGGGAEWRSDLDDPLSFLAGQARAADLVVLGRGGGDPPAVDPGDAVMHLGRPVLVVPPGVDRLDGR